MQPAQTFPLAVTLALALLGACSQPASQTATDASATTAGAAQTASDAAATAAANAADPGGVVSPPQPNSAVDADASKSASEVAPASNSFTEGQAKGHIENAGYSDVTNLTKTPDGMWTAKAKKGGKAVDVAVDFKGAVTPK